jgi:hypothetical protein
MDARNLDKISKTNRSSCFGEGSSEGAPQEREQRSSAELLKKHLIQTPNNGYSITYTRKSTSISTNQTYEQF